MKNYTICLERKDRNKMYRYFTFEHKAANFNEALKVAESKIEKLKLQIGINYEVIKIEKI